MSAGQALVGGLTTMCVWMREELDVMVSETHGELFQRNEVQARAELRATFGVSQPGVLAVADLTAA